MPISEIYKNTNLHILSNKIYKLIDNTNFNLLFSYYWNMHRGNSGFSRNSIKSLTANSDKYAIILPTSHYYNPNGQTPEDYEEQETRSRIYYEIRNDTKKGFSVLLLFNLQLQLTKEDEINKTTIIRQQKKIEVLQEQFENNFHNIFVRELGSNYICYNDDTCRRFALKIYPHTHKTEVLNLDKIKILQTLIQFHDYMQPILENFLSQNTALLRKM